MRHPRYGVLLGRLDSVSVRHDRRRRTAEVDVVFTQNREDTVDYVPLEDVAGKAESDLEASLAEQRVELTGDARAALGAEAEGLRSRILDPAKGILDQFSDYAGASREYVKTVDAAVSGFEAALNEVAAPANSLIATIDFKSDVPGRLIGSIAGAVDRYVTAYEAHLDAPSRFLQSFRNSIERISCNLI